MAPDPGTRRDATWLTPAEQRKLVPQLLVWSQGKPWEAAFVQGLRGVIAATLLPALDEGERERDEWVLS